MKETVYQDPVPVDGHGFSMKNKDGPHGPHGLLMVDFPRTPYLSFSIEGVKGVKGVKREWSIGDVSSSEVQNVPALRRILGISEGSNSDLLLSAYLEYYSQGGVGGISAAALEQPLHNPDNIPAEIFEFFQDATSKTHHDFYSINLDESIVSGQADHYLMYQGHVVARLSVRCAYHFSEDSSSVTGYVLDGVWDVSVTWSLDEDALQYVPKEVRPVYRGLFSELSKPIERSKVERAEVEVVPDPRVDISQYGASDRHVTPLIEAMSAERLALVIERTIKVNQISSLSIAKWLNLSSLSLAEKARVIGGLSLSPSEKRLIKDSIPNTFLWRYIMMGACVSSLYVLGMDLSIGFPGGQMPFFQSLDQACPIWAGLLLGICLLGFYKSYHRLTTFKQTTRHTIGRFILGLSFVFGSICMFNLFSLSFDQSELVLGPFEDLWVHHLCLFTLLSLALFVGYRAYSAIVKTNDCHSRGVVAAGSDGLGRSTVQVREPQGSPRPGTAASPVHES